MQPESRSETASPSTGRSSNRPVHTIRYGTIRAAIWRNVVDLGNASRELYNVTFSRSYKDSDDQWNDSSSFALDDLLVLAKAADEAHTWIMRQKTDVARTSSGSC